MFDVRQCVETDIYPEHSKLMKVTDSYETNTQTSQIKMPHALHNVATFTWYVRSVFTPGTAPYLTVSFGTGNHGSWVDVIATITHQIDAKEKRSQFAKQHRHEVIPSSLLLCCEFSFRKFQKTDLLWIHAHDLKVNVEAKLKLQMYHNRSSKSPNTEMITRMEWHGSVSFSSRNPTFCLSTTGHVFNGSLKSDGNFLCIFILLLVK